MAKDVQVREVEPGLNFCDKFLLQLIKSLNEIRILPVFLRIGARDVGRIAIETLRDVDGNSISLAE